VRALCTSAAISDHIAAAAIPACTLAIIDLTGVEQDMLLRLFRQQSLALLGAEVAYDFYLRLLGQEPLYKVDTEVLSESVCAALEVKPRCMPGELFPEPKRRANLLLANWRRKFFGENLDALRARS
jgi:hypothetical protein